MYHGLDLRHLRARGLLMRPQLNSGTLGRQKANRNLLAPSLLIEQASGHAAHDSQPRVHRREHEHAGCAASAAVVATGGVTKQDRARDPFGSLSLPVAKHSAAISWPTRALVPTEARPGAKAAG
jgi:hypothetical protein